MARMRQKDGVALMTDILKRFQTVLNHADKGIDPVWLEFAVKEIDRLRALITTAVTAEREDDIFDAIAIMREVAYEWE